jgi:hypothetical protein
MLRAVTISTSSVEKKMNSARATAFASLKVNPNGGGIKSY